MTLRSPLDSLAFRPLLHGLWSSKKSWKQHSLSQSAIVSRKQISEPVGLIQADIFSVELRC